MNKTKNNTFVLDLKSNQKDQCAEFNCIKLGEYKAPFSRKNINTYIYFCLEHVREILFEFAAVERIEWT